MRSRQDLESTLSSIDGRGYSSYKQLSGMYDLGQVRLAIDHVQVDPYAPPSKMRVIVDRDVAGLPDDLVGDSAGRIATGDFLARRFAEAIRRLIPGGDGGPVSIGRQGQEVLERTSVLIADDRIEARIEVGLPASGRRVRGREATGLITGTLPRVADAALRYAHLDPAALAEHVTLYRDQEHLQAGLAGAGLVSFVADGAILPRRSGDSDLPMASGAVPFTSPSTLRTTFELPSGASISGMGVPEGVTVIVGGGYHGKSTLLRAMERGVYPHIGGDGREWVISRPDAVTVRAEDGRAVTGVDISPFITNLPSGTNTRRFTTTNASGSTSQAANLVEALESGASALLIDEDTSATNFMIRDDRMRRLIPADREPITPFIDRIRSLYTDHGVSTILVAGGSGAFFDVADHVIALDAYRPEDVTVEARRIAGPNGAESSPVERGDGGFNLQPKRVLGVDAGNSRSGAKNGAKNKPGRARGRSTIQYGGENIDLSAVAQLVDPAQTTALAHALDRVADAADGRENLSEIADHVMNQIEMNGLDWLSPHRGHPGFLARPRRFELHAALNRYRRLRIR